MMGWFGLVGSALLIVISFGDGTVANKADTTLRIKWMPHKNFNPDKHEIAGWMPPDKEMSYYICRDHRDNGQYLGFFQKGRTCAVLINGKREMAGQNAEALWYPKSTLTWAPMPDPYNPPPNLFLAGFDGKDGEALYICRGAEFLSKRWIITPGNYKFNRKENKCEVDHNGVGVLVEPFEMLYLSFYGIYAKAVAD